MPPQFFPVDYDPWADPEDTASAGYAGMRKVAGAVYHTVVDPWTRPLSEPYKGAVLPFSSQGKGDLSFDSGTGLLGGIKSGATLPADVYAGRVNPLSSEGFGRVQDAASLLSGGPMLGGGGAAKASMGFGDGIFTGISNALKSKSPWGKAEGSSILAPKDTPLKNNIFPSSHFDWTKGKTPHDLIQHYDWVSPSGKEYTPDVGHNALQVFAGDKKKAIDYVTQLHSDFGLDPSILPLWTKPIEDFKGKQKDLPLPMSQKHLTAFDGELNKGAVSYGQLAKDTHEYMANDFDFPLNFEHPYEDANWPKAGSYKSLKPSPTTFTPPIIGTGPSAPLDHLPIIGRHGPFLPEPPTVYTPRFISPKYQNAFTPVDWQDLRSPLIGHGQDIRTSNSFPSNKLTGYGDLTDDKLAEILRQGYNPNLPLFKGLGAEKSQYAYERGQFTNPLNKPGDSSERAIFFSDHPEIGEGYGSLKSFFARPQNPFEVDWQKATRQSGYTGSHMAPMIDAAWDKGADALVIRNISDIGGNQTQYLFRNPGDFRFSHAEFDPAKAHSPQLLWSGGLPIFAQPVNYDPWEKSQ